MANLPEVAQWELGTYQIETTDPVLGGADGPDNLAAKQLGNRTAWLKAQLPFLAPLLSAALTGSPTAPTAIEGTNTQQLATTAFVQAEIERVVDAAPAAIDTLAELATALNNDPDFAVTITTQLALKAPLADPGFSGNPTAPTQLPGNASTSLATTAFVTAAVNAAIAVADATTTVKGILRFATAAEALAGAIDGVGISPSTLKPLLDAKLAASIYTQADVFNKVKAADGNGSGLDTDLIRGLAGDFGRVFANEGLQRLPGGLQFKWGRVASIANDATATITFPTAFPTACTLAIPIKTGNGNNTPNTQNVTAANFQLRNRAGTSGETANSYSWLALGY